MVVGIYLFAKRVIVRADRCAVDPKNASEPQCMHNMAGFTALYHVRTQPKRLQTGSVTHLLVRLLRFSHLAVLRHTGELRQAQHLGIGDIRAQAGRLHTSKRLWQVIPLSKAQTNPTAVVK